MTETRHMARDDFFTALTAALYPAPTATAGSTMAVRAHALAPHSEQTIASVERMLAAIRSALHSVQQHYRIPSERITADAVKEVHSIILKRGADLRYKVGSQFAGRELVQAAEALAQIAPDLLGMDAASFPRLDPREADPTTPIPASPVRTDPPALPMPDSNHQRWGDSAWGMQEEIAMLVDQHRAAEPAATPVEAPRVAPTPPTNLTHPAILPPRHPAQDSGHADILSSQHAYIPPTPTPLLGMSLREAIFTPPVRTPQPRAEVDAYKRLWKKVQSFCPKGIAGRNFFTLCDVKAHGAPFLLLPPSVFAERMQATRERAVAWRFLAGPGETPSDRQSQLAAAFDAVPAAYEAYHAKMKGVSAHGTAGASR